jgi:S1-C subfamily serine protease
MGIRAGTRESVFKEDVKSMNTRRKTMWPVLVAILSIALLSWACSFSVGGSPSATSFAPLPTFTSIAQESVPTDTALAPDGAPAVDTPAAGIPAAGTPAAESTTSGVVTPQATSSTSSIPATGNEPIQPPNNLEDLYSNSNPGVVSILVQVNQGGQSGAGAGSGFILDNDGHVVTNHHVIDGASTIVVRFYNNSDTQAKVVGDDPNSDLAILQVANKAEGIHPLPLGDSSKVRVGDGVVAIGNPFALGTSMSSGIVSAIGRTIPSGFTPYNIPQAIQTDAAINPGNSGGPLINMGGQVIGINAQIQTGGQGNGNVGIGFAIPINILKTIAPSLIQGGSYTWPYLGVAESSNPFSINASNTQAQQGALIDQVTSGGPADQAGMQEGDVIIQADSQKITSFDDLLSYVAFKHPGDKVQLLVVRGGQQQRLTVTLGARPAGTLTPQQ